MIESLHPVTMAVAIACVPVAAIALSAGIDYLAHRHQQPPTTSPPGLDRATTGQLQPGAAESQKALPANVPPPSTARKP